MAGSMQTRISIYADDKASAQFRAVGREADGLVQKLLGMGPQVGSVLGNTNSSEALDRLVHAVTTAQPEMLRTLGLAVNFESAYAKAAQAMGKNAASLTEAEKLQIRVNATLEAGARYAGIYELSMQSASKQLGSFTRYWSDFQTMAGEVFLEALAAGVFGVNNQFRNGTIPCGKCTIADA